MMKQCAKCREIKPHEEYHNDKGTKDKKCVWCKSCKYEYNKRYIKQDYVVKKRRDKGASPINTQLRLLKESTPCADCGVQYPYYVMDFDHRPGEDKEFNIARISSSPKALEEIKKCDIVCSNCHRQRTYTRLSLDNKPMIEQFSFSVPAHCGKGHEYTIENTYNKPNGQRRCKKCHSENQLRRNRGKGVKPKAFKLADHEDEIRELVRTGPKGTSIKLAKKYNVSPSTITNIVRRNVRRDSRDIRGNEESP